MKTNHNEKVISQILNDKRVKGIISEFMEGARDDIRMRPEGSDLGKFYYTDKMDCILREYNIEPFVGGEDYNEVGNRLVDMVKSEIEKAEGVELEEYEADIYFIPEQ